MTDIAAHLSQILKIQKELRHLSGLSEITNFIATKSAELIPYDVAVIWRYSPYLGYEILTVFKDGVATARPKKMEKMIEILKKLKKKRAFANAVHFNGTLLEKDLSELWSQALPHFALSFPFVNKAHCQAGILFCRKFEWARHEITVLNELVDGYAYAFNRVSKLKDFHWFKQVFKQRRWQVTSICSILSLFIFSIPVQQTTLAKGEVAAHRPLLVTSEESGIIQHVYVEPNQLVKKGQALCDFVPQEEKLKYQQVAQLQIALKNKWSAANENTDASPEAIAEIKLELDKATLEKNYLDGILAHLVVKAPSDGIVLFHGKQEWVGKNVQMGERLFTVANPEEKELILYLPVDKAIYLPSQARTEFYLNVDPFHKVSGAVYFTSYMATPTFDGHLVYELRASLPNKEEPTLGIGLHGTAKIYGENISFGKYILSKPVAYLHSHFGV